ncbi:hypothetical protein [Streptomyces harbinensis]|uniref:hypothetical protein n=1 Tax=Streptomyces harbinensis TaxID=1176198 RepID=UPI0036A2D54D
MSITRGIGAKNFKTSVALAVTTTALLLPSCSSSEGKNRAYEIPDTLCDVEMVQGSYDTLFPPGKEVSKSGLDPYGNGYIPSDGLCNVYVDGAVAIGIDTLGSRDWGSFTLSPGVQPYLVERSFNLDIDDSDLVSSSPNEVRIWANFAAVHVPCAESSGMEYTGMNVSIDLRGNENRDFSEELREIAETYALDRIDRMGPGVCDNP